ncbi:translation initiation factor 2 [cyanobiont of Ornithocercus magnificus]|nr:translation initiation factor 2 [cyanobiont of Ornithocercus magnificus]
MNRLISFSSVILTVVGVLGLAASGIFWNFQGRTAGLPATIASLLVLAVGILLLRPRRKVQASVIDPDPVVENVSNENIEELATSEVTSPTKAPVKQVTIVNIINYAPKSLQPANTLRLRRRRPGASLRNFRNMASEIFRG